MNPHETITITVVLSDAEAALLLVFCFVGIVRAIGDMVGNMVPGDFPEHRDGPPSEKEDK